MNHPFHESMARYREARSEFARFIYLDEQYLFETFKKYDRDEYLNKWYSFYVHSPVDEGNTKITKGFSSRMQIHGGFGITGRYDNEAKYLKEVGLALVYSFGPSGEVAVIMYPTASDGPGWKAEEDNILIGYEKCYFPALHKRIKRDMKDLVAYGHVTSINGQPTLREKLRVKWLRFSRARNIKNEFTSSKKTEIFWKLLSSAGTGSLSGVFRLLTPILAAYLLLKFGFEVGSKK